MRVAVNEALVPVPPAERFTVARGLGAEGVELTFGPHGYDQHALWRPGGPATLKTEAAAAQIMLPSVFAGYFLDHPLTADDPAERRRAAGVLDRLLDACAEAGVGAVVLPCVGAADLNRPGASALLLEALATPAQKASVLGRILILITVLPAAELLSLLEQADPSVRVAYDPSHAPLLGRDAVADLKLLGDAVRQVRVNVVGADVATVIRQLVGQAADIWWVLEATTQGEDPMAAARAGVVRLKG